MAITQQQLDDLEAAITNPTEEVRFKDRSRRLRPVTDLIAAHDHASRLKTDADTQAAGKKPIRQVLLYGGNE